MLPLALMLLLSPQADLRTAYDVQTYRLDLKLDPDSQSLTGTVGVEAIVTAPSLSTFELDLMEGRTALSANLIGKPISSASSMAGAELKMTRQGERIRITLPKAVPKGQPVRVAIRYQLKQGRGRNGIRFAKTPDGKPWINTSCQSLGAHSWWPCKNDNEHPEDKFARLMMNVDVPKGLFAVSNGKLLKREPAGAGRERFRWQYDKPCENYAVTLNVAPYVEVKSTVKVPGVAKPMPFHYYVLPQDLEKAKLQFQDVQQIVTVFSEAFGPYPYVSEKFGLVQTNFWGMEHSTAVAYGNSFPAWIKKHGGNDSYAAFNRFFDYILVHEIAHEWWGNGVSAKDWGHLWLHEGFGTYAEAVFVEKTLGREAADEWLAQMKPRISPRFRQYRGKGVLPSQAFSNNVYYKGAWILSTLRYYVNDDAAWWKSLRDFNMKFRYKNAVTEDFQAILEQNTKRSWKQFFAEWFYGDAYPAIKGTATLDGTTIRIEVDNPPIDTNVYHVPLFLSWTENGQPKSREVLVKPGKNSLAFTCGAGAADLKLVGFHRVLGDNQIEVK